MADRLFLSDNAPTIKRDSITDDEGNAPPPGLTARCFYAAQEGSMTPIDPSLDQAAVPVTGQKIRAVFSGALVTEHIEPLLTILEGLGKKLDIWERVIVAGSYDDNHPLRVQRYRRAGRP